MDALPPAPVPDWAVPSQEAVRECWRACYALIHRGMDAVDRGTFDALAWVTIGEQSPLTRRLGTEATWEGSRAESWLALCLAADQYLPTERDWQMLGVERRPPVTHDWEYAYGVWRALAWMVGARKDPPVYYDWHAAAEVGRGADAREDALRYWRYIRERVDAAAGS